LGCCRSNASGWGVERNSSSTSLSGSGVHVIELQRITRNEVTLKPNQRVELQIAVVGIGGVEKAWSACVDDEVRVGIAQSSLCPVASRGRGAVGLVVIQPAGIRWLTLGVPGAALGGACGLILDVPAAEIAERDIPTLIGKAAGNDLPPAHWFCDAGVVCAISEAPNSIVLEHAGLAHPRTPTIEPAGSSAFVEGAHIYTRRLLRDLATSVVGADST